MIVNTALGFVSKLQANDGALLGKFRVGKFPRYAAFDGGFIPDSISSHAIDNPLWHRGTTLRVGSHDTYPVRAELHGRFRRSVDRFMKNECEKNCQNNTLPVRHLPEVNERQIEEYSGDYSGREAA